MSKTIDVQLQNKINRLAKAYFRDKTSPIEVTCVNVDVLSSNGIDYKEYVTSGKSRLRRFLESFPDIFLFEERIVNSGKQVYCTYNAPSQAKAEIIIAELIKAYNGKYLLALVSVELEKHGIKYANYSNGRKLSIWLKEDFNGRFCINDNYVCFNDENEMVTPIQPIAPASVPTSNDEIAQMHSLAFMFWWSAHAKTFKNYLQNDMKADELSAVVAHNFSLALAGIGDLYYYVLNDVTRMVFNTGIKSKNDNSVYCVLQTNPLNDSGDKQAFSIVDFCCVMEEDNELSTEIKQNAPELLKSESWLMDKYEELSNNLDMLIQYQRRLVDIMPELSNAIASGTEIEKSPYKLLKAYYDKWESINEAIEYLGWEVEPNQEISIDYLIEHFEYNNKKEDALNKAVEISVPFLESICKYCFDNAVDFMVDVIEQDIKQFKEATVDSVKALKELISYYRSLIVMTEQDSLTDATAEAIAKAQEHFSGELSPRISKLVFFNKSCDELGIEDKSICDNIIILLNSVEVTAIEIDNSFDAVDSVGADELLMEALEINDTLSIAQLVSVTKYFCESRLERALVASDFKKCREIIESGGIEEAYGISEKTMLERISALESGKNKFVTFYSIGVRLLSVIGNYNSIAEKYFIAGLVLNDKRCVAELIKIYLKEDNADGFLKLYGKYGSEACKSVKDITELLRAIGSISESELKQYLLKNIQLLYIYEYLSIILEISEEHNYTEVEELCRQCAEHIRPEVETNEFESSLLSYADGIENSRVKSIVDSFLPRLDFYDYSEKEIGRISNISASLESDSVMVSPIVMLYKLQGNKNSVVENYIRRSLLDKYNQEYAETLMVLLCEEERYNDACMLYDSYEDSLKNSIEARNAYIEALVKEKSLRFFRCACSEFQSCMYLLSRGVISADDIQIIENLYRQNDMDKQADFCAEIVKLGEYMTNPVICSIITLSNDLREIAIDREKLIQLGLDNNRVDEFLTVYKTDAYSRERSLLGVAKRLYSFIGAQCSNITEIIARLAMENGYDASALIWKIFDDTDDSKAKLEFLLNYPEFREGREREFCLLLLEQGEYELFISEVQELGVQTSELLVQIAVAKAGLKQDASEELEAIESIEGIRPEWLAMLTTNLYEADNVEQMYDFVADYFDDAIMLLSGDELHNFVTGNDILDEEALKAMQKVAVAKSNKLALYIYETLGIGRMKGASKDFFTDIISNYNNYDKETKLDVARQVRIIYSNNEKYLTKLVLAEISNVLITESDKDVATSKVEESLNNTVLNANGIIEFMSIANKYALKLTAELCVQIIRMCVVADLKKECIEFFMAHNSAINTFTDMYVLQMVCRLYVDALENDYYEQEWSVSVENLAFKLLNSEYFYIAQYCLYLLETNLGRENYAEFVLLMMLEKKHEIPSDFLSETELVFENPDENNSKTIYDLFADVMSNSAINEITDYCNFCGRFIDDEKALKKYYEDVLEGEKEEVFSPESCIALIKLLCICPDNIDYWKSCLNMPLKENSVIHSMILYRISILGNKDKLWKNCIDACERYSLDELLMEVLISCAKNVPEPYGTQNLRKLLTEKVTITPAYFSQQSEEKLEELISIMASRFEISDTPEISHNAIKDLSVIAIATDSERVLNTLLEKYDKYILGENANYGFAIACRLILRKRFAEAKSILNRLAVLPALKYKHLVSELASMDINDIELWGSKRINVELLEMILPDGNYPNIMRINNVVIKYSSAEMAEEGASLICKLLKDKPDDFGSYMALFILCKYLPDRIDMLHKALCGLITNDPGEKSVTYYSRTKKDYAFMLASINAVASAQGKTEEISAFDGYDFSVNAREFYQRYESRLDDTNVLSEIQSICDEADSSLKNQSEESKKIICELIVAFVTGGWRKLLLEAWRSNTDLGYYITNYSDCVYSCCNGMARSILEVAYSLDENEQKAFIAWVVENILDKCSSESPKVSVIFKQASYAVHLYNNRFYELIPEGVLDVNILNLPFEEYSVINELINITIMQIISKAPGCVYPCAMLVAIFASSAVVMNELLKLATESFEASKDVVAYGLFKALHYIGKGDHDFQKKDALFNRKFENYESMMRVSGVFSNDEATIKKVSNKGFHAWSCINMVLALLYTSRANEVERLKSCLSVNNKTLVDVIMTIIDNTKSDDEKISAIFYIRNEITRGMLCFIASYKDRHKVPYFLTCNESVEYVIKTKDEIASKYPNNFYANTHSPKHYIWIEPSKIKFDLAHNQIDDYEESRFVDMIVEAFIQENDSATRFSFVSDLEAVTDYHKSIDELWEEHERINAFGLENYSKRLELSELIYRVALGRDEGDEVLCDYAIRYGVDYYYYHMGKKQYSRANDAIFEMVNSYNTSQQNEGNRMLKNVVCTTALHEILHRGYSTISELVDAFTENKQAFVKMRNMLPATTMSIELNDVNSIYSALEIIVNCLSGISASHSSAYKTALDNAKKQLNDNENMGWSNLKASVRQMIQDEINKITKRPILNVSIINETAHRSYGYIFGQVENIGNDTAEDIKIQLEYSNDLSSVPYTLPRLEKGEMSAFEIRYSVDKSVKSIEYSANVTYKNKGEKYNNSSKHILTITEKKFVDYPYDLYYTDRPIGDFRLLDDGTIYSDNFFGREEEKRKINSLFASGSFENYKNVIIKGIRRAGKTSILNYLCKYVEAKCDDAVAIYSSCEGVRADMRPIQKIFVDRVIKECSTLNIGEASQEEWQEFIQRWTLPENVSDREADDLQYFYRELKNLNGGKGLMLVIDEFDILLEELEKNQGIYNSLLPSLRVLLNNINNQMAVHLVICGSNKLIRYMDGGTLNQLFQQFGDNVVEVGKLLEIDMKKMLEFPYSKYSDVEISQQALKWIWKYTNGLVWYSKLITNCALERARSQERYVVYPTDVFDALITVTSHHDYFKSLVTSCRSNELKVLDAMQSLTSKATEYVSMSKLLEVLSNDFSQKDIEGIINTLEMMQFVQRNPYDRSSYRFAVELYWHYFRVTPSNYNRVPESPFEFIEGEELYIKPAFDYSDF